MAVYPSNMQTAAIPAGKPNVKIAVHTGINRDVKVSGDTNIPIHASDKAKLAAVGIVT